MVEIVDRLVSLVTALGTSKDKSTSLGHMFVPLGTDQIAAAYRGDWIARKIVDIPAFDMIREGRNWQAEDDQIELLEAEEARLQVWPKLFRAQRLARLWGGSAMILGTGEADPTKPLEPKTISKGGLAYIHVVSCHEITAGDIDRDPASPGWGQPKDYTMAGANGATVTLHSSRVIPFIGNEIPDIGWIQPWGDSVLQVVDDAVKNAGLTAAGIAQLVQEAKLDVYKIPNFMTNVGDKAYRDKIVTRVSLVNQAKSTVNGLLMDKEEEYEQKQVRFSDLPEVMQLYLQIASGAADIPATRLLGQAPAGMNSTGESDLRNYYDRLAADQEVGLRPRIAPLDECLIPSALGTRPPEVHYTFAPLWQLSATEQSAIRKQDAETAKTYVDSGLVPTVALAKAVQNQLVEQGSYPGLEAALDETKATVGLGAEMMKTIVSAWTAGGMPLEDFYGRLKAAGMTTFATFEAFKGAIEEGGEGLGTIEEDEIDPAGAPAVVGKAGPELIEA